MKFIYIAFVLIAFSTLSFAQGTEWIATAVIALTFSTALIAILYAIGFGFNVEELKIISTEEFYQLIVTAVMIGVLFGSQNFLDTLGTSFGLTQGIQGTALQKVSDSLNQHQAIFNNLKSFSIELGDQSSRSLYCTWQGIGYNAAACSSFRALAPPVSLSMQALSVAVAELQSLYTLISFAQVYSFTLLLPVGILLRTIKLTRGAGGLFIGLAVSLYLFLPLAVLFMDSVISEVRIPSNTLTINLPAGSRLPAQSVQVTTPGINGRPNYGAPAPGAPDLRLPEVSCDIGGYVSFANGYSYANADEATRIFTQLNNLVYYYLYSFLIEGTIFTIVALLTFITSLRWIAKLAGADVDVFALARIA